MVKYKSTSPYYNTNIQGNLFLDVMSTRNIPFSEDDTLWEINATYNLRPDLLAFDLYSDSSLWWVFSQRNPDVLLDPLNDFIAGNKIYIPNLSTLKSVLGF